MEKFMKDNSGTAIVLSRDNSIASIMKRHGSIPVLVFIRAKSSDMNLKDKLDNVIQDQCVLQGYDDVPTTEIIDSWERELLI